MGEGLEYTFWCMAIVGTIVFVFKLVMLFLGLDSDGDADVDFDADGDSTAAFHYLSVQSVACLAMGTGWMGLVALVSLELGALHSWSIGIAFGVALVFASAKLMQWALRLESSGTLDLQNALGQVGTVYLNIPADGQGQVQVVVQGRLVTVDARSSGGAIPTGDKVRVESVDSAGSIGTLVVTPL